MGNNHVSSEKKLTLLLLCWLFGLFGIHRFYTGKNLTAGLQLLTLGLAGAFGLSTIEALPAIPLGLLFIWWLVDIMRIIMGKFTDKEGRLIVDWV